MFHCYVRIKSHFYNIFIIIFNYYNIDKSTLDMVENNATAHNIESSGEKHKK